MKTIRLILGILILGLAAGWPQRSMPGIDSIDTIVVIFAENPSFDA
jgi:phospholipase C